jgi:hypothetical protein
MREATIEDKKMECIILGTEETGAQLSARSIQLLFLSPPTASTSTFPPLRTLSRSGDDSTAFLECADSPAEQRA